MQIGKKHCITLLLVTVSTVIFSCKKFVSIDPPDNQLILETVFANELTATAALAGLYSSITNSNGGLNSLTFNGEFSADNSTLYSNNDISLQFYQNNIVPLNDRVFSIWNDSYGFIYKANAIIAGLEKLTGVSASLKTQLVGEAKFLRAFYHFYLVNLFGDVPNITTTDYRVNNIAYRTPKQEVYQQIITDLKEAQSSLGDNYIYSNNERVRPNKWAATAFLARVYLYIQDWANAEIQSTSVINQTTQYSLIGLTDVFKKNSLEAIWQLIPPNPNKYTNEGDIFLRSPTYSTFSQGMLNAFEVNDQRRNIWVGSVTNTNGTFYYPTKYKEFSTNGTGAEYSMVLRLAEQYLIRAESRAMQNKLIGTNSAASDINIIRTRAGLLTTIAATQIDLLAAIEQERRVELFAEWGHRWLDLKRTGRVDAVLSTNKLGWISNDALYPIPESEMLVNPNLVQNAGY